MGELIKETERFAFKRWNDRVDAIIESPRFENMKKALDDNMPEPLLAQDLPRFKMMGRILKFQRRHTPSK